MQREKMNFTVAFRVTEEQFNQLEAKGKLLKISPHDAAREVVTENLADLAGMTYGQRMIYEEVARIRYMLGHGFGLYAAGRLTPEAFEQVRLTADQLAPKIAETLLARHRGHDEKGGVH